MQEPITSQQIKQSRAQTVRPATKRGCYVHNPYPEFTPPSHHKGRPILIRKGTNLAKKRDVCAWGGFRLLRTLMGRRRHFNIHARRAINALIHAILHYVNLATWQVETSVECMARETTLDTRSAAGNRSITRASRRIADLEAAGVLECDWVWDKTAGTWLPKLMHVTERFWDMIGVPVEEALKEREIAFERAKELHMSPEMAGSLTLTEYRKLRKINTIQRAIEIRQNKIRSAREIRRAKRLAALPLDEQRRQVANTLMQRLRPDESAHFFHHPQEFNTRVTREMARIRTIAACEADPSPQ